jgi:hypothetical protein
MDNPYEFSVADVVNPAFLSHLGAVVDLYYAFHDAHSLYLVMDYHPGDC